ncbi:hypothetical protein BDW69DRAFT_180866 [Aspergillus filifer]
MSEPQQPEKDIRPLSRYITTHTPDGKAVFSSVISESMPSTQIPDGAFFSLAYTTSTTPASISSDSDIQSYAKYLEPGQSPGLVISSGSVCRIVDMPPGALSPMHRTVSLDYGVVLEGVVALELDSGERRVLKRGDVAVQRGTNHAWRNLSEDGGWARMLYVLLPAEKVVSEGRELGEELGEMGIRSSE